MSIYKFDLQRGQIEVDFDTAGYLLSVKDNQIQQIEARQLAKVYVDRSIPTDWTWARLALPDTDLKLYRFYTFYGDGSAVHWWNNQDLSSYWFATAQAKNTAKVRESNVYQGPDSPSAVVVQRRISAPGRQDSMIILRKVNYEYSK
jgi:hypothetical protein